MTIITSLFAMAFASTVVATPTVAPACVQFSQPFRLAAQVRSGRTEQESLSLLQAARTSAPTAEDVLAEKDMATTIRWVYLHSDLTPGEIERKVQAACSVDVDGRVHISGL